MSTTIDVPGSFLFSKTDVKFRFWDGRELDLTPLILYEPARQLLKAALGVGIQELMAAVEKPVDAVAPEAKSVTEGENMGEALTKQAEEFLRTTQEQVDSFTKSFGG